MKLFERGIRIGRRTAIFVAILVLGPMVISSYAQPSSFASVAQPIGVAFRPGNAAGKGILVTTWDCPSPPPASTSKAVLSFDSSGAQTGTTLLPLQTPCIEDYIAVSPAGSASGWPANRVYVAQGTNVYEGMGSPLVFSTTPFATIPAPCALVRGITFDKVGSFGHQMIVTCDGTGLGTAGQVWTVGPHSSPAATLIATVGEDLEGPDVAPMSFGSFGGCVFATDDLSGDVWAVCPSGSSTVVATWPGAEGVRFIPSRNGQPPCEYDSSGGAFFYAAFPTAIFEHPATDFTGLGGNALVVSESGAGLGLLTPALSIGLFPGSLTGQQHEGATFIDFSVGCR